MNDLDSEKPSTNNKDPEMILIVVVLMIMLVVGSFLAGIVVGKII